MTQPQHLRFLAPHAHLGHTFGSDWFGHGAEVTARFFGTPTYLIGQTVIVILWIIANGWGMYGARWDPYPFILLNLAFSLQAAYAAPLILLAQTRQAERDKMWSDADAKHREELSARILTLLQQNTDLTEQVQQLTMELRALTAEIHDRVVRQA